MLIPVWLACLVVPFALFGWTFIGLMAVVAAEEIANIYVGHFDSWMALGPFSWILVFFIYLRHK